METTTIQVRKDTRDDVMLFKIKCRAKNADEAIRTMIKAMRKIRWN